MKATGPAGKLYLKCRGLGEEKHTVHDGVRRVGSYLHTMYECIM